MSEYSGTTLNTVLGHFEMSREQYTFKPLTDGYINDTFMVLENDTPLFILQRVNHQVFKDMDGLMGNVDKALQQLDSPEYSKITLIKTLKGKTYFEDGQGYWRLMTFIHNSTAHNTTKKTKVAFEAGRIIGQFHMLLQDAEIDEYIEPIPRFHDLNLRKEQFHKSIAMADASKKRIAKDALHFAEEVLEKHARNVTYS